MADITINGLTAVTAPATTDEVGIWDVGAGQYKKVTRANLIGASITGGGTIALGGYTLTVPATGTAALLSTGNIFSTDQTITVASAWRFDNAANYWRISQDVTGANGKLGFTKNGVIDAMSLDANGVATIAGGVTTAAGKFLSFDTAAAFWRISQDVTGANGVLGFTKDGVVDAMVLLIDGTVKTASLAGSGNRAVYSTSAGIFTNSSSDARLKTDVAPIDNEEALWAVSGLRPVRYNWKDTEARGDQREIGLIAQDVAPLVPEVVGVNTDGMLSLDYARLVPVLIGAIQELSARVAELEKHST